MDIDRLKEHILENDLIPTVLAELGCHHISHKDGYYSCANPDGDNVSAVTVYENDNLTTVNYTRDITNGNQLGTDLISLVEFYHHESFPKAIKWICDAIDLEYYHDFDADVPESIKLTKMLLEMQGDAVTDDDSSIPLKPVSEHLLKYYRPYVNKMFYEDGVSYTTQKEFEIGYDEQSDRITIPIRDELGNLVGVKARYFWRKVPDDELKFVYLVKCARSQILYGLYRTLSYIGNDKRVFVTEAEKGVQQLVSYGYNSAVATGGKKISKAQIEKLTRLCVPIVFCFDKDVEQSELEQLADRFVNGAEVYALIDKNNILDEKQSPTDDLNKFKILLETSLYKLK